MSDTEWPAQRPEGGRHRAPAPDSSARLPRVLAPIVAVAVVVALIVVLVAVRGHSSGSGPGAGVITAPTGSPVVAPTLSTSPSPSGSATAPLAGGTVTETHAPPTPSLRPTHPAPAPNTAMALVRVYNSTHITGLAHHVAAEIAARGWTVPDVGNVVGVSPDTTVYYSPSAKAAALHLAHEFSGIRRVRPNSEAKISYHGLTLVLTADWHD